MWKRWFQKREQAWKDMEELTERAHRSIHQLSTDDIRELGLMYRSVMNDLSRAQSDSQYHHLVPYLNNLAQRIHARVYETPPSDWRDVLRFFTHGFPTVFWSHGWAILMSLLVFILGAVLSTILVQLDPQTAGYFLPDSVVSDLEQGILWTDQADGAAHESSFLMTNNIMVALKAYAGGILLGVGTLFVLFFNGFQIGGVLQVAALYGQAGNLLYFMIAHGVIELSTIFFAGAAGMIIGFRALFPGDLPRWEAVRRNGRDSLILILGCVPLLVVAGVIEGMFSLNNDVPDFLRLLVGVMTGILLYGYLMLSLLWIAPEGSSQQR